MKTWLIEFIKDLGNGWAIVNAETAKRAESVFLITSKFKNVKITNIKETKYFGEHMQICFEGAVSTIPIPDGLHTLIDDLDTLTDNNSTLSTSLETQIKENDTLVSTIKSQQNTITDLSEPMVEVIREFNTGKKEIISNLLAKGANLNYDMTLREVAKGVAEMSVPVIQNVSVSPYENPVLTDMFSNLLISEEEARQLEGVFEDYKGYYVIEEGCPKTGLTTLEGASAYVTSDGHFYNQGDIGDDKISHKWDRSKVNQRGRVYVMYLFKDEDYTCTIEKGINNDSYMLLLGGKPRSITVLNSSFHLGIFTLNEIEDLTVDFRLGSGWAPHIYLLGKTITVASQMTSNNIQDLICPVCEHFIANPYVFSNSSADKFLRCVQQRVLLPKVKKISGSVTYGNVNNKSIQWDLPNLEVLAGELVNALVGNGGGNYPQITYLNLPKLKKVVRRSSIGAYNDAFVLNIEVLNLPELEEICDEYSDEAFEPLYFQIPGSYKEIHMPKLRKIHVNANGSSQGEALLWPGTLYDANSKFEKLYLPSLTECYMCDRGTDSFRGYFTFLRGCPARVIELPNLEYFIRKDYCYGYYIHMFDTLQAEEIIAPKFIGYYPKQGLNSYNYMFCNCPNLKKVVFGAMPQYGQAFTNIEMPNLIHFELGEGHTMTGFSEWSPSNALDENSTSLVEEGEPFKSNREKLVYNIREYIAKRAMDRNDTTSLRITFSTHVYDVLTEEIMEIFINKNWTVSK